METTETKSKFVPSAYQAAIYDFVTHGKGNAVISAVAGSGKTTTIVNALKLIDRAMRSIFIAFNKSIITELRTKLPDYVDVSTIHSIGWKAVLKFFKQFKPTLNARKYDDLLKVLSATWDLDEQFDEDEEKYNYVQRVRKLIDLARVNMVELDNVEELEEFADKHGIEVYNGEAKNALNAIKVGNKNKREFDYTDMIYIPALLNLQLDKYDWVFVDECQDLNKAQQQILRNLINPNGGRFIAVGDPAQAIYGFAGADVDSFDRLKSTPNTIELPLSVCYRCGKNIIQYAQSIVPHLSYPDTAKDGIVRSDGKNVDIKEGDYVLCRNTAPLVMLCLQMLGQGKKAMILGGDIGKTLINMIKKTKKKTPDEMFAVLEKDLFTLKVKLAKKKKLDESEVEQERQVILFKEKVKVLEIIVNEQRIKTTETLISRLEKLFSDEVEGIVFSTIHKSKGLEANRVHIICKEMMPSKWAKKTWEKVQESNLEYVAYTRAKNELVFNDEFVYDPEAEK